MSSLYIDRASTTSALQQAEGLTCTDVLSLCHLCTVYSVVGVFYSAYSTLNNWYKNKHEQTNTHTIGCARSSWVRGLAAFTCRKTNWSEINQYFLDPVVLGHVGLPDVPYFKGCPVFGGTCPASHMKARRGATWPVFRALHKMSNIYLYRLYCIFYNIYSLQAKYGPSNTCVQSDPIRYAVSFQI